MCQSPVGKVIKVNDSTILIEHKGKTRELDSKLVDVKVGEYVMFSLNIAIDKIDEEEAKMILGEL
ncbi:MAG: HypC/HybG/HupF family hydrogenase formation chaperone [Candidatus Micrarchaeaceae archaeon]|jgi:hydrogenase maturation factor